MEQRKFRIKWTNSRNGQCLANGVMSDDDGDWLGYWVGYWVDDNLNLFMDRDGRHLSAPPDWRNRIIDEYQFNPVAGSVKETYTESADETVDTILLELRDKIMEVSAKYPPYHSLHEAYGKMAEEFREVERHVFMKEKLRAPNEVRKELMHLAVTAIRTIVSCGPDYRK